ncbi:hypothetical protein SETIT_5G242400v2 [Setaria italica]|uniref:Uncharacterized protein n=1 Tax=Setaria italica TaxID=4555 RepID=K3XNZ6_SETIT|nr:hypothetical protein SETIT_5G242400v2 [Setaria italica]
MMRRPLRCRNRYTAAPSGHSMTPATTKATNPSVGPSTLHRHGLLRVPHCTHTGTNAIACCCWLLVLLWKCGL